ncbi:tripartite tricarboxylate transporter substrate binding protein [Ramlibacter sp. AW1]|uniref:Tripartite tricarboxylate transporter substrate binding protein n=2 Tax=Ramlibacter aurantiacus TaxID=2801330 RepID=A0A937D3D5_9BURK|nr:tripartite tricarboxylate transporter substrate binding protein [Ramlibacter aurantiacus]
MLFALAAAGPSFAQADSYPSKPIRIIVPFPPGGGTDLVARTVAAQLGESWKVPVTVDNRPGGNTVIGAELASRAAPDGYTLFLPIDSTLAMNQSLYARLPYDPINGFAPVTLAVTMPMVLAVHPSVQARSVNDLVSLAKAPGSKLAYAHGALPAQVAGEAFKSAAKLNMVAVPYKGSGPAMTDVVGGQVPVIFDALGPAMAFVKSGKVRPLAVTSAKRSPSLPEVPTLGEAGLPVDLVTWIGFVAPAGTDRAVVAKLHGEITRILKLADVRDKLAAVGMDVVASSPEQFAQTIKDDAVKLGAVIKAAGIKLD